MPEDGTRRVPLNRTIDDMDTLVSWVLCPDCGERKGSEMAARECCDGETPWSRRYVQPAREAPEWAYEYVGDTTEQQTLLAADGGRNDCSVSTDKQQRSNEADSHE